MAQTEEVLYAIPLVLLDLFTGLQIRFHFPILKSLFLNLTLTCDCSLEWFLGDDSNRSDTYGLREDIRDILPKVLLIELIESKHEIMLN